MTRQVYSPCQACAARPSVSAGLCPDCAARRAEAHSMLARWPRIRFLSNAGVERVVGRRLDWPLSAAFRNLLPRQLVAAVGAR